MKTRPKLLIVHGFFMKAPIMWTLERRLQRAGFDTLSISYASYRLTLEENVARNLPRIQEFAGDEPLHYLGHSLGGLFIRHLQAQWPAGFSRSRVVTLGTPHQGCSVAEYLKRRGWQRFILRGAWTKALDGSPPPWPPHIPLLSVAGSNSSGLSAVRLLFGVHIHGGINDGVVGYEETLLPEAQASLIVYETHLTMLFATGLIAPISRWLERDLAPTLIDELEENPCPA